ncbi:unnamed protein product [Paramecium primaurelia]|uniref:Uncharacterized protein n=2 Tax=Paramecium TaxID=5884 RepID=A0A8S1X1W8_9CILI|nr:unnamed protein product [Paramecium primaurelia]CAD8194941.1 unnamed protein product [Paramecium pentaurelia]
MNKQFHKTSPPEIFLTIQTKQAQQEDSIDQIKQVRSVSLEKELAQLNDEQETYDMINEIEYKMLNFRSDLRRERAEIESTKSQQKLLEIVAQSKIKQLETSLKFSVEALENKFIREQGTTNGYVEYIQQSISQQKKEDASISHYIKLLEKRVASLEFELGIENVNNQQAQ